MTMIGNRKLVTVADLAERYEVSKRTIKRWTAGGILPKPLRVNDSFLRYDTEECDQAIQRHSAKLNGEAV